MRTFTSTTRIGLLASFLVGMLLSTPVRAENVVLFVHSFHRSENLINNSLNTLKKTIVESVSDTARVVHIEATSAADLKEKLLEHISPEDQITHALFALHGNGNAEGMRLSFSKGEPIRIKLGHDNEHAKDIFSPIANHLAPGAVVHMLSCNIFAGGEAAAQKKASALKEILQASSGTFFGSRNLMMITSYLDRKDRRLSLEDWIINGTMTAVGGMAMATSIFVSEMQWIGPILGAMVGATILYKNYLQDAIIHHRNKGYVYDLENLELLETMRHTEHFQKYFRNTLGKNQTCTQALKINP